MHSDACPFLDALPVEIRVHIYEYILFEKGRFFSLDEEIGCSVSSLFPKLRSPKSKAVPASKDGAPSTTTTTKGRILALLLTSHKVYSEAVEVLYGNSFFRLRGIEATSAFINNASWHSLDLIRSLKLVWDDQGWRGSPQLDAPALRSSWPSLCAALSRMRGLHDLYIGLGVGGDEHVEALYVEPLYGIRGPANFKVCIPVGVLSHHYGLACRREWPGAPFVLCRHLAGDVCEARREVMRAEWTGCSRPPSPRLPVPELLSWGDGVDWEKPGAKKAGGVYGSGGQGDGDGEGGGDGDGDEDETRDTDADADIDAYADAGEEAISVQ